MNTTITADEEALIKKAKLHLPDPNTHIARTYKVCVMKNLENRIIVFMKREHIGIGWVWHFSNFE